MRISKTVCIEVNNYKFDIKVQKIFLPKCVLIYLYLSYKTDSAKIEVRKQNLFLDLLKYKKGTIIKNIFQQFNFQTNHFKYVALIWTLRRHYFLSNELCDVIYIFLQAFGFLAHLIESRLTIFATGQRDFCIYYV